MMIKPRISSAISLMLPLKQAPPPRAASHDIHTANYYQNLVRQRFVCNHFVSDTCVLLMLHWRHLKKAIAPIKAFDAGCHRFLLKTTSQQVSFARSVAGRRKAHHHLVGLSLRMSLW